MLHRADYNSVAALHWRLNMCLWAVRITGLIFRRPPNAPIIQIHLFCATDAYSPLQPCKQDYHAWGFCVVCTRQIHRCSKGTIHIYILYLQVQVSIAHCLNLAKHLCLGVLTSEESINCCCSFCTYLKEHSLKHIEILCHGSKRVYRSQGGISYQLWWELGLCGITFLSSDFISKDQAAG